MWEEFSDGRTVEAKRASQAEVLSKPRPLCQETVWEISARDGGDGYDLFLSVLALCRESGPVGSISEVSTMIKP